MTENRLVLIDGHALIYRAYHAFPGLTSPDGVLVNAVYGFARILLTAIQDLQPNYLAVTFDHPKATFRHESYVEYKANRAEMPDNLKPQIQIVKDVVASLNIPIFEMPGYEADDLIGTLALQAGAADTATLEGEGTLMTIIVTGDRDAFQLVDEVTHVWMPGRGKGSIDTEYEREGVYKKMGVFPEQITDLKALMGDSSDNIPGVKGIGEKTAVKLITEFHNVEELYARLEAGTAQASISATIVNKLVSDKANALMSKVLATIDRHVPIELNLPACLVTTYEKPAASELFEKLNFKSLIPLLPKDDFELGVQSALF